MVRKRANRWRRLAWGLGAATALVVVGLRAPRAVRAFDLDDVARRAQAMAAEPFHDPNGEVPDWLLFPKLQYDQWRDIRFRPDKALWRERPALPGAVLSPRPLLRPHDQTERRRG